MAYSPIIERLIQAFRCLPGVGPKSAQRMAFYLLERNRHGGVNLAEAINIAMEQVNHCQACRMFCEQPLCGYCQDQRRDRSLLCIVESPADVMAVEQTGGYHGLYFVLMGHLSPLDGIGPEQLGIAQLLQRLPDPELKEVILATNATVEGDTTAHYLADLCKDFSVKISRIAYGVPLGGELEFVDGNTLWRSFNDRIAVSHSN